MKRFKDFQRVTVVNPDGPNKPLLGMRGSVVRLRRADCAAWVRMDDPLPAALRSFPAGDERADHIILWPDECDIAAPTTATPTTTDEAKL